MNPAVSMIGALAEEERLRVFGLIAARGDEGIGADELERARPGAARLLKQLVQSRMVVSEEGRWRVDRDRLRATVKNARPDRSAPTGTEELANFYESGRLRQIPVKRDMRVRLLEDLAKRLFAQDAEYAEKQVTERLLSEFDDPATLRRYLVDEGLLDREPDGSVYRRRS
ncbi:DUF2087 domain-containing protein [Salininema proteolyticum]|uniref:DUF2087 domain-containing protein n=1 Tax=Salininema proteolyticum TaxID=1607685 RepID=A0ABV8TYU6_9ACTN